MQRLLRFLILAMLCLPAYALHAKQSKVVFINPGHPQGDSTGAFWAGVNRFMVAAANDLDLELSTLFARRDHILMKRLANDVHKLKPDYIIIVNEKGVGVDLVRAIAKHNIPIFTLLNSFTKQELDKLTEQQKSLLIGSLVPDNYLAGKGLLADLYELHENKPTSAKPYQLLALRGDYRSAAALDRVKGLHDYLTENDNIHLFDSSVANWSEQQAYKKVKGLLQRHSIDIIWAANDPMAYGASRAVKEAGLTGKVTIGGFNWDALDKDYPIDASYGGHVTLGAKALVMLNDYQAGLLSRCEMKVKQNIFQLNNNQDLEHFLANTKRTNIEAFDFSRFSKAHKKTAEFQLDTFIDKAYKTISSQNSNAKNLTPSC